MTKALKNEIQALVAELEGHIGSKQAQHALYMAEFCTKTSLKEGGRAYLVAVKNLLVDRLTTPQMIRVVQTSPETEAWGGFLSQDVFYVEGKPLRAAPR